MADPMTQSPDSLQLRSKPLASARLSRKAVFTVIAALAVILGVVIINVSKGKPVKTPEQVAARELQPALNTARDITKDVPDFLVVPQKMAEQPPPAPPPKVQATPVDSPDKEARLAGTSVRQFAEIQQSEMPRAVAGMSQENPEADDGAPPVQDWASTAAEPVRRPTGGLVRVADHPGSMEQDLNQQSEKQSFSRQSRPSSYLNSQVTPPRSEFELKTGTVIPAVMITAINSDLPGEIIAQVSQSVYDTATGRHLLIPQGTRLFGSYDSHVTYGQSRALVSWQRLIFPNAYTLELGGMNGHDQAGASGYRDRVNHHYGQMFGWALLTSVLSAGAQLSQPQQSSALALPSQGQVAAAAVGQQMTQLGAQIASRNIQVQPTIEIRKGYRMNVMVNRDIVFPSPYHP